MEGLKNENQNFVITKNQLVHQTIESVITTLFNKDNDSSIKIEIPILGFSTIKNNKYSKRKS